MNNIQYNAMANDIKFTAKQLIICRSTLNKTNVLKSLSKQFTLKIL